MLYTENFADVVFSNYMLHILSPFPEYEFSKSMIIIPETELN